MDIITQNIDLVGITLFTVSVILYGAGLIYGRTHELYTEADITRDVERNL